LAADAIGGRGPDGGFDLLRVATVRDAAFISRTVISAWRDAYRDFLPWPLLASLDQNPHHDRRAWEERIKEPASVTWIISDISNDVGVLRITTGTSSIPDTDSQLTTLYLLQQARGCGLGSEALMFARAEAARRSAPVLGVCVLAENQRGRRFYERRGARRIGERVAFRLDDEPIVDILYRFDWDTESGGLCFGVEQESGSRWGIGGFRHRRPGESRDPFFRRSEFSSNGGVVPAIIRSCRGSMDPGLRRGGRVNRRRGEFLPTLFAFPPSRPCRT
jgi:ribosomal protein S18 acetylase RimI-like enzyme